MKVQKINRAKILLPTAETVERLSTIEPGVIQCYYDGFLAGDIEYRRINARHTQEKALDAYYAGAVELVQLSLGFGKYLYLAIGKKYPRRPIPRPVRIKL